MISLALIIILLFCVWLAAITREFGTLWIPADWLNIGDVSDRQGTMIIASKPRFRKDLSTEGSGDIYEYKFLPIRPTNSIWIAYFRTVWTRLVLLCNNY